MTSESSRGAEWKWSSAQSSISLCTNFTGGEARYRNPAVTASPIPLWLAHDLDRPAGWRSKSRMEEHSDGLRARVAALEGV